MTIVSQFGPDSQELGCRFVAPREDCNYVSTEANNPGLAGINFFVRDLPTRHPLPLYFGKETSCSAHFLHVLTGELTLFGPVRELRIDAGQFGWFADDSQLSIVGDDLPTRVAVLQLSAKFLEDRGLYAADQANFVRNVSNVSFADRPNNIKLRSLLADTILAEQIGYEYVEMPSNSVISFHKHEHSDAAVYVVERDGAFLAHHTRVNVSSGCHGGIPKGCWHGVEAYDLGMDFISVQVPAIGQDYVFAGEYPITNEVALHRD